MELYTQILAHLLSQENAQVTFPGLQITASEIVEQQCYQALCKIKAIIEDDSLTDEACFTQIEAIVCTLEEIGSDGGVRHDFS